MHVKDVETVKDTVEELMNGWSTAIKMSCMFPVGSPNRAFYHGKAQAYLDAVERISACIEGDGYDDKWYVQREAKE